VNNFLNDLQKIYNELSSRQAKLNSYFNLVKGKEHKEAQELVDSFLEHIGLPKSKESIVASLTYLINLREDNLDHFIELFLVVFIALAKALQSGKLYGVDIL